MAAVTATLRGLRATVAPAAFLGVRRAPVWPAVVTDFAVACFAVALPPPPFAAGFAPALFAPVRFAAARPLSFFLAGWSVAFLAVVALPFPVAFFAVAFFAVVFLAASFLVARFAADSVGEAFVAFFPAALLVLAALLVDLVVALPVDLPLADVTVVAPFLVAPGVTPVRPPPVDFAFPVFFAVALGEAPGAPTTLAWDAVVFTAIAPFRVLSPPDPPGEELMAVRGAEDRAGTPIPQ